MYENPAGGGHGSLCSPLPTPMFVTSLITSHITCRRNQLCHLSASSNFKIWHFIYRK